MNYFVLKNVRSVKIVLSLFMVASIFSLKAQIILGVVNLIEVKEACPTYNYYQDSCLKMEEQLTREIDSIQREIERVFSSYQSENWCNNSQGKIEVVEKLKKAEVKYQRKVEALTVELYAIEVTGEKRSMQIIKDACKNVALRNELAIILDEKDLIPVNCSHADFTNQVINEVLKIDQYPN